MKKAQTPGREQDPRDLEIERLRALVNELNQRNALLQEALRQLQQPSAPVPARERSRL